MVADVVVGSIRAGGGASSAPLLAPFTSALVIVFVAVPFFERSSSVRRATSASDCAEAAVDTAETRTATAAAVLTARPFPTSGSAYPTSASAPPNHPEIPEAPHKPPL